jgi:hypothetical protein
MITQPSRTIREAGVTLPRFSSLLSGGVALPARGPRLPARHARRGRQGRLAPPMTHARPERRRGRWFVVTPSGSCVSATIPRGTVRKPCGSTRTRLAHVYGCVLGPAHSHGPVHPMGRRNKSRHVSKFSTNRQILNIRAI